MYSSVDVFRWSESLVRTEYVSAASGRLFLLPRASRGADAVVLLDELLVVEVC